MDRDRRLAEMSEKQWKELEALCMAGGYTKRYDKLIKLTEKQDEHPEWYESDCWCATCRSYADY